MLINFRVPDKTQLRFDAVCRAFNRTRTSVLLDLMNDYIVRTSTELVERKRSFVSLDTAFNLQPEPIADYWVDPDWNDDWSND